MKDIECIHPRDVREKQIISLMNNGNEKTHIAVSRFRGYRAPLSIDYGLH